MLRRFERTIRYDCRMRMNRRGPPVHAAPKKSAAGTRSPAVRTLALLTLVGSLAGCLYRMMAHKFVAIPAFA